VPASPVDALRGIVGPAHVLTGADCGPYVLDGRAPEAVVLPGSKEEVAAVLLAAGAADLPVTPWGGGTKMGIGAPPQRLGLVLGLKRLNRLLEHEPGDLTATAQAGMTLGALQRELGTRGQWLSLDPAHADEATLGGIVSSNAAGPRRHLYGACRDLVIGLTVVTAAGTLVKGGGKVVKNVAGYDLPKLFVGAFGTLGVIVEATVKLRPRPDVDRMVVARFASLKEAGSAARAVMGSDLLPSALDLVDGETLRALELGGPDGAALLIGVDGIAEQVHWQCSEVERMLRWVVLPAQVADVMEQGMGVALRAGLAVALAAHAGVGVVEAVLAGGEGADATKVSDVLIEWRTLVRAAGGQALVESAPLAIKERVPVWDDLGPALRIMQRIKSQLDPSGLLNPGRFAGGI